MKEVTDNMNDNETELAPNEAPATCQREGEDRSSISREASLPEGIQAVEVTHYQVGKYSYTNLDDAMAEHRRQSNGDVAA